MSEDDDYSRRRLLGTLIGVGTIGATGGAATGAYLSDRVSFPRSRSRAGTLTLELAADAADDDAPGDIPDSEAFDDRSIISVGFPELEPGDEGVVTSAYRICDSSGQVWLRTRLDGTADTELERHLHIRLFERPNCEEEIDEPTVEGSLADLIDGEYGGGVLLGDEGECVGCDPGCLDLEWALDDDLPSDLSDDSVSLALEFAAVQCRHRETPENP